MRATADKVLGQVREFFSGLSKKERNRLVLLGVLIIGLSVTAAWLLGRVVWVPLYAELTPAMAGQYKAAIEDAGYTCRLEQGGTTIAVPKEQRSEILVMLGAQGIGDTSQLDYSLYNEIIGKLGATDKDRAAMMQWQIAEHLQATLGELEFVDDVKVLISMGDKSTGLLKPLNPTTASIMVGVAGGQQMTSGQAMAIISTAAGAVEGLLPENITLTDKTGIMYDSSGGSDPGSSAVSLRLGLEQQTRSAIERSLNNLLVPVTGAGNLRVTAYVELDLDQTSVEQVVFEPPVAGEMEGLKRSAYELWETSPAGEEASGVPGTDSNGVGAAEYPYLDAMGADDYFSHYERELNYELNETRTKIEKERGAVKALSVSILVNSSAVLEDHTAAIRDLASKALGVDGDQAVSVHYLPFVPEPETPAETGLSDQTTDLLSQGIKGLVVLLLGLAVVGFLRSLIRSRPARRMVLAEGGRGSIDYLADGEYPDALTAGAREAPLAPIDGRGKDKSLQQLEDFIERDPQAVTQLLRNWLSDT